MMGDLSAVIYWSSPVHGAAVLTAAASELNQLSCVHVYCPTIEAGKRWGQVSSSKASVTGSNLLTHKVVEVEILMEILTT